MKSREAHGTRALLSCRKALLNKTIDLANEVRDLLKVFGLRLPRGQLAGTPYIQFVMGVKNADPEGVIGSSAGSILPFDFLMVDKSLWARDSHGNTACTF